MLSKGRPKQLFFTDEDTITTESQFHLVSYFTRSLDIAYNVKELSDFHSFDTQYHSMNENIGGNVGDITSEVEMVEKLQNQEIRLIFVQNIKINIMKAEKLLHF